MKDVDHYVFTTACHPAEEGGPIYRTEAIRNAQRDRAIDQQTNNHLVRHRLLILERLHADLLKEYAENSPSRIKRLVVEVNRNLRELSGLTSKKIKMELESQLASFKKAAERLEKAFEGKGIRITPGLIRKARIAEDLGWKCPYTGQSYDEYDLLNRVVDKDHIIPRSQRPSDSLSSLVITFSAVNKMKKDRTAYRFIETYQGQPVEGMPNLTIKTLKRYLDDIEALDARKGHQDDRKRKKERKALLALPDYVEKEFKPRDLTQTSQLVRFAAQVLSRPYSGQNKGPAIISLSGHLTAAVRTQWNLLGCLSAANPQVIDSVTGEVLPKGEIREITHLHHALDASVLGLAAVLFSTGEQRALELLNKRRLTLEEQAYVRGEFGQSITFTSDGQPRLADLPTSLKDQLRERLGERRVVQHIPAELSGLRVEQNAWRVVEVKNGVATLKQRPRTPEGKRVEIIKEENVRKLFGTEPASGIGKLKARKAVLVIPDNFGVALEPFPQVIPFFKVPVQLRELRKANGGKPVRVLRNGMIIDVEQGRYKGTWRIFSIKNNKGGIAIDMGYPDVVRLKNKTEGHKINVALSTLLKDGIVVRKRSLTGRV